MHSFFQKLILATLLVLSFCDLHAQSQAVKSVSKSIFTLTTFKKDGTIISTAKGFFVGNNGEAVSPWTPFIGASRAVIIDANGKKMEVSGIIGANEIYDICKFQVSTNSIPVKLAVTQANTATKTFIVDYSTSASTVKPIAISSVEKFKEKYFFYLFKADMADNQVGLPIANANGQVIGMAYKTKTDSKAQAVDARLTEEFKTNGLSLNNPILRTTHLKIALPADEQQALLTVMMAAEQTDSATRASYVEDFINQFPASAEGYSIKATNLMNGGKFEEAAKLMEASIQKCTKKDEAHSNYAKLILLKETYKPDEPFAAWNLDKAMQEVREAYRINPQLVYQHQMAQITFSKGQYQEAYEQFINLTKTSFKNGELFYEAAQCKQLLKAPHTDIVNLLDSAIAVCPQPLNGVAAPYVLARGIEYDQNKEYRKALSDYNRYDTLMLGRVNHNFYYTRYKCELQTRLYQQALTDIARAIILNPGEPTYYAEMASLQLRVRKFDDAYETARRCTILAPEYADGWLILGLVQQERGNKAEAKTVLQKAKELGDLRADKYLNKL